MQNTFNGLVHASARLATQTRRLEPSYGRSTRFNELSARRVNILGSVLVAVVFCSALWAVPFSNIERELVQNVTTARAAFGTREETIHKPQFPAISLTFICEHLPKLTEAGIGKSLGQRAAFNHPSYVQVFDADSVVSSDQIGSHFIQVILSGVSDVFVYPSNANALPIPPSAALNTATEGALGLGNTSVIFVRMPRVTYASTVAQGSKAVNSKINSYRITGLVELGKLFVQNQRDEVAPAGAFGDCDGRWGRLKFTAPIHIESPQTRNSQIGVIWVWPREFECGGRVCGRLLTALLLKARIPGFLIEELNESVVQISQRLLNWNTGHFTKPNCLLLALPLGQFGRSLVITDPLSPNLPSIRPIPQCAVVGVTAATEHLGKLYSLSLGWRPPELVSNLHTKTLYA